MPILCWGAGKGSAVGASGLPADGLARRNRERWWSGDAIHVQVEGIWRGRAVRRLLDGSLLATGHHHREQSYSDNQWSRPR
jgi:hypothetical protein